MNLFEGDILQTIENVEKIKYYELKISLTRDNEYYSIILSRIILVCCES